MSTMFCPICQEVWNGKGLESNILICDKCNSKNNNTFNHVSLTLLLVLLCVLIMIICANIT